MSQEYEHLKQVTQHSTGVLLKFTQLSRNIEKALTFHKRAGDGRPHSTPLFTLHWLQSTTLSNHTVTREPCCRPVVVKTKRGRKIVCLYTVYMHGWGWYYHLPGMVLPPPWYLSLVPLEAFEETLPLVYMIEQGHTQADSLATQLGSVI